MPFGVIGSDRDSRQCCPAALYDGSHPRAVLRVGLAVQRIGDIQSRSDAGRVSSTRRQLSGIVALPVGPRDELARPLVSGASAQFAEPYLGAEPLPDGRGDVTTDSLLHVEQIRRAAVEMRAPHDRSALCV